MPDDQTTRALDTIAKCSNARSLRQIAKNAGDKGNLEVQRAAKLRLYEVAPDEEPGTFEHAVWGCIFALEDARSSEEGKTVRLSRTRQKIKRDGELKTVRDLITGKASRGFEMLIERSMPQFTFETVALRFPERFDPDCLAAARARLDGTDSRT